MAGAGGSMCEALSATQAATTSDTGTAVVSSDIVAAASSAASSAEASAISKEMGLALLMDIDPRIMRGEFFSRWPGDCLMIRQFEMAEPDVSGTA